MSDTNKVLTEPLVNNNPITLQILGICSALAVTSQKFYPVWFKTPFYE
jgi:Na+-transporting NADH:ubiquinone oxidoreductase subunit D